MQKITAKWKKEFDKVAKKQYWFDCCGEIEKPIKQFLTTAIEGAIKEALEELKLKPEIFYSKDAEKIYKAIKELCKK